MRMGRSGEIKFLYCFNRSVELFFNTDIKNFLTVRSSIKWVIKNYLKVLFVTSPLWLLLVI